MAQKDPVCTICILLSEIVSIVLFTFHISLYNYTGTYHKQKTPVQRPIGTITSIWKQNYIKFYYTLTETDLQTAVFCL